MPSDPQAADRTRFPDPVYQETVLSPLFETAKTHHAAAFGRVNRAHLVMLAETGILAPTDAKAIAVALRDIDADFDPATVAYTGEVEDFFFHIEAELKRRLGPDIAGRLHTGRSRNDIDHTLFKIALKNRIDRLARRGRDLVSALIVKATRERDTLIVAYTHGQPAQPSTFGHYLAAATEVLLRDLKRLNDARAIVDLSPMGAAAITTTGFPIDRQRVADLLGFAAPLENSYGCIAAVDYVTAAYSAVKLIFLHLGRVIQDFQQWASAEVGQLYVPNAFVQISSIMPQKRNPVPIEHLRLLASLTGGRAETIINVMHNTPFTDMNDSESEVQAAGYAAFESGDRALHLMAKLIASLRVDPARVRRNADAASVTITELADGLVRGEGLSFRQAHEIAAEVAKVVAATGTGLGESGFAAFRTAFKHAVGRPSQIDAAAFREMTSLAHFVAVRDRFGGPAPVALDAALTRYRAELDALESAARTSADDEARAATMLDEAVARLVAAA